MQGPSLYFGAEDELEELHRHLDQNRRELGISWGDLADSHLKSLAGEDALLGTFDRQMQTMRATPLCAKLETRIRDLGAICCMIDTSADVFGGDEISRSQVRQFVSLLRGIAIRTKAAVILLAHPSMSGMQSGSGTSGSTHWHNAVRSRLYLTYGEKDNNGEPIDPDERFLRFKKSNYGPRGKPLRLRWQNGLFVPDSGEKAAAAASANAEATFLAMLDAFTKQNRYVSSAPSANYAPKVFSEDPRCKADKKALVATMNALFAKNSIKIETFGPQSRQLKRIVQRSDLGGACRRSRISSRLITPSPGA